MNKKSYTNARKERLKFVDRLPFEPSSDSATENAGRNGFNLQEMARDIDGVMPEDIYDIKEKEKTPDIKSALNLLAELGDVLDREGEEVFANFVDDLMVKIAQEASKNYLEKFNDLILKINTTNASDVNDTIKKLTNIFSKTMLLEFSKHEDLEKAYESAYKKTLTRADQYVTGGKMIKSAGIDDNPAIVAERIKLIIDTLVSRFSNDARYRAYPNLRSKVQQLNPSELSQKKSPGGAALGVAITLIKNILNGRDPQFINLVIANLTRLL